MDAHREDLARSCLAAAYDGSLSFPDIVGLLADAGFDGYLVDFRRDACVYYLPDGDSLELPSPHAASPVAEAFRPDLVADAVREAQANAPGYSYPGFCAKVTAAGCAGYLVSILGRRVIYFSRNAQTHIEPFPQ